MKAYSLSLLTSLLISSPLLAEKPNIIFILADDMGIGDVSHTGGKAATPAIDRLANEGMRFTDAHTTSAVCSPTRYGILTGRYNWRSFLKNRVIIEPSKRGAMIRPETETVAEFLKNNDYHTAFIGKWHLGLGWHYHDEAQEPKNMGKYKKPGKGWDIDFSKKVDDGPSTLGFDYSFYIAGSLDMAPYVYLVDDKPVSIPTHVKAFHRAGPATADFEAVDCLKDFAKESVQYINERAKSKQPFFLYLPLTSPHTPIVPSKEWKGKSSLGQYGDFLMETDWVVGEVIKALDANKIAKNTLIIFTTDNGCSPRAKIPDLIEKGHKPNGDLRGHKADIYEGGHRVPFVVRWPGKAAPASISHRTITSADFFATVSEAIGVPVGESSAVDSFSFLPTLTGKEQTPRPFTIHHSIDGNFAIRQGKWKLCLSGGSGGWSRPKEKQVPKDAPAVQLFDLEADLMEKNNLALKHPEQVNQLIKLVNTAITEGRTTPGAKQENDTPVPPFSDQIIQLYPAAKR